MNQGNYPAVNILLIVVWLFSGAFLLVFLPKGELIFWLNQQHNPVFDAFFRYLTVLGDGIIFAVLGIIFLFVRFYYFFILVLSALLQTIIVQGLKRFVFVEMTRPRKFLELDSLPHIHFVEGVTVHNFNSFPSGHSATAFAIFTLLALIYRKSWWTTLVFFFAAGVAISRVYLLQHFLIDIYFGSIIGMVSVAAVYFHFEVRSPALQTRPFWSRPLIRIR